VREEFGAQRTECACAECQLQCRFRPGFLVPSDLGRMIPKDADPLTWAEGNLLASPGSLVSKNGVPFRIPTLVPKTREDGACINLTAEGRCVIWENAPCGCAYWDCGPDRKDRALFLSLREVHMAQYEPTLYAKIWDHLYLTGRTQEYPEVLAKKMLIAKYQR